MRKTLQKRNFGQTQVDLEQLEHCKSLGHCKTGHNLGAIFITNTLYEKGSVTIFGVRTLRK